MKDFFKFEKKHVRIAILIVLSIFAVIIFFQIASRSDDFFKFIRSIFSTLVGILKPVLYGAVIAFLLYKPCLYIAAKLGKIKYFEGRGKLTTGCAVFVVNIAALGLLSLLIYAIIPKAVQSITQIVNNANQYVEIIQGIVDWTLSKDPLVMILEGIGINVSQMSEGELVSFILSNGQILLENFGSSLIAFVLDTGTFLYNFIFGFIIAIYINLDFHSLKRQFTGLLRCVFIKSYPKINEVSSLATSFFFDYLVGKAICSVVMGVFSFFICVIFKVQFALLIAVIITISNMIPIFGPWIGAIPSIFFAFLTGLKGAVVVGITILAVQWLDSYVLGPKIIGNKVNLNPFWIIVSILLCGALFGIIGMIIGIPVFALLRTLISRWIHSRKEKYELEDPAPAVTPEDK